MAAIQQISACLWFDRNAEEAVNFYTSVFKDSRVGRITFYGAEGYEVHKMPEGTILTIEFELNGSRFMALNGGPVFRFNEAVSFVITCNSQEEIDYYWEKLTEGGDDSAQQCGWLKDKYGLSWQVAPEMLSEMLADEDRERADRVMKVMMQMKKISIEPLELAYRKDQLE